MKSYYWKGITLYGNSLAGYMDANSPTDLQKILLEQKIALLSFKERKKKSLVLLGSIRSFFNINNRINLKQKVFFFNQLYLLVNSGIKLLQALEVLLNQIKCGHLHTIIKKIICNIKQGKSFALAIKGFEDIFDSYIINLISAGEGSGRFNFILKKISQNLEQRLNVIRKIRRAALLPIITLMFSLLLVFGIFVFVIPQFEMLFNSFDKNLPKATEIVFNISRFLRSDLFLFYVFIFICFILFIKFIFNLSYIKQIWDKRIVKKLGIGKTSLYYDQILFLQTLGMFLEAGIDIQTALTFCGTIVKNSYFKELLINMSKLVIKGEALYISMQLATRDYFSRDIIALVEVGEQTGRLGSLLARAADICSQRLQNRLKVFIILIQPILLIFVAFIIVLLMLSVYLPIFDMAGVL